RALENRQRLQRLGDIPALVLEIRGAPVQITIQVGAAEPRTLDSQIRHPHAHRGHHPSESTPGKPSADVLARLQLLARLADQIGGLARRKVAVPLEQVVATLRRPNPPIYSATRARS